MYLKLIMPQSSPDERCRYDYVEIVETQSRLQKAKVCGQEVPEAVLSRGPAKVRFVTDSSRNGQGFHLRL